MTLTHHRKTLVKLCWFMEILLLLAMVIVPVQCIFFLYSSAEQMTGEVLYPLAQQADWIVKENVLFVFDNIVIFLVLLQIYFFFSGVRHGELFTRKRIRNTRYIGFTLVFGYLFSLAFRYATGLLFYEYHDSYLFMVSVELYGLLQILLGTGLIALSCILEQAKELKDEQDLVI
ncbi:DUF2975 domain-containing protein [Entomohabitans teleogrylli]|uniref:DUF2975 domain-containing protein n=1 Tax=Entomohabitans teleogrylli TaxID=1384589 RepID=UPI00073DB4FB|nr:DUF2975 domain-containing protein [Entomohabitans teleogrylli]